MTEQYIKGQEVDQLVNRVMSGLAKMAEHGWNINGVQVVIHPAMWDRLVIGSNKGWPTNVWKAQLGGLDVVQDNYIGVFDVRLRTEVSV